MRPIARTHAAPRRARTRIAALVVAILALTGAAAPVMAATPAGSGAFDEAVSPAQPLDPDRVPVELGVRLTSERAGQITGLQFYRGPGQRTALEGTLWSADGRVLARTTFPASETEGWQAAALATPVAVRAGQTVVASYYAQNGSYPVTEDAFTSATTQNGFRVPAGAGVYRYGESGFPTDTYRQSDYLVDVVFTPSGAPAPTPQPTPAPTPSPAPEPVPSELDDLDRIPWEGGSEFWEQFPDAREWTDPGFFPIGVWWGNVSSDAEAQWDRAHGINYYAGMWDGTDFDLLERNGQYWLGGRLNATFDEDSPNWPGVFLDDEVDGWTATPEEGFAHLQRLKERWEGSGKFTYANFTSMVIGPDMALSAQERYVNDFADVVSVDTYWHTAPYCDWTPYRGIYLAEPVPQETCHSSSSYGKTVTGLAKRDAADGERQPLWNFIELLNPSPLEYRSDRTITGPQIQGAAMSSIINEARGLIYFNQSFGGPCPSGAAIRDAQVRGDGWCGSAQIEAMGDVNNFIHRLAPVLNTQSYAWSFGDGLDTMLKTSDGSAYIFAMTDGGAGERTFTLPDGVDGQVVEVVEEDRSLPVSDGTFSDTFSDGDDYHVYRVALNP